MVVSLDTFLENETRVQCHGPTFTESDSQILERILVDRVVLGGATLSRVGIRDPHVT